MDTLAHLTSATRARRALLNDTLRALPSLFGGRGVTPLAYDPGGRGLLQAAGLVPRTLLHPALPGFKT
jgi:hypothetical protein